MYRKCYLYKLKVFQDEVELCKYLDDHNIPPDHIVTIYNDRYGFNLIYYNYELRHYRKDGSYEKI